MTKRPFIPQDKPRFWVIFILAGLITLAVGLAAFVAAWLELRLIEKILMTLLKLGWGVMAVSWLGFAFGVVSGRYRNLKSKAWKEQVW